LAKVSRARYFQNIKTSLLKQSFEAIIKKIRLRCARVKLEIYYLPTQKFTKFSSQKLPNFADSVFLVKYTTPIHIRFRKWYQ